METPIGTHIIGDLRECDPEYLFSLDLEKTKIKISEIIQRNGMHELGNYFYHFGNNSFTCVIALSESHISIHTWPELGVVNMDVYTCNYQHDNTESTRIMFRELAQLFGKSNINKIEVRR